VVHIYVSLLSYFLSSFSPYQVEIIFSLFIKAMVRVGWGGGERYKEKSSVMLYYVAFLFLFKIGIKESLFLSHFFLYHNNSILYDLQKSLNIYV